MSVTTIIECFEVEATAFNGNNAERVDDSVAENFSIYIRTREALDPPGQTTAKWLVDIAVNGDVDDARKRAEAVRDALAGVALMGMTGSFTELLLPPRPYCIGIVSTDGNVEYITHVS